MKLKNKYLKQNIYSNQAKIFFDWKKHARKKLMAY